MLLPMTTQITASMVFALIFVFEHPICRRCKTRPRIEIDQMCRTASIGLAATDSMGIVASDT